MTPIQNATFNHIFNGKNVIARDKTGSGKTFAFAIPIIEKLKSMKKLSKNKNPVLLVLTPTRELCR